MKLFPEGVELAGRDALTLKFSEQLASAGMDYLRVHDVAGHTALFERLCT
jgi:dihydropteroate synthase